MTSRDALVSLILIIGSLSFFQFLYFLSKKFRWFHDLAAEQIENYITQLLSSFGRVTSPINAKVLKELYDRNDFPSMLGWIKNSLRLELRVGLRIVDAGGQSNPMWIEIPRHVPMYGTPEFKRTQIIVNVRKEIIRRSSFDWIVAGFAHELSHVVLSSISHPLQHNEKAVDLTAMIFWIPRIYS